jgi:hypothetical protein
MMSEKRCPVSRGCPISRVSVVLSSHRYIGRASPIGGFESHLRGPRRYLTGSTGREILLLVDEYLATWVGYLLATRAIGVTLDLELALATAGVDTGRNSVRYRGQECQCGEVCERKHGWRSRKVQPW